MKIAYTFVADAATTDASGKLNTLGIFDSVFSQEWPLVIPRMCLVVVVRAVAGEFNTEKTIGVEIFNPDKVVIGKMALPIKIPPPVNGVVSAVFNALFNLEGVGFEKPGQYMFGISINDVPQASVILNAIQVSKSMLRGPNLLA